MGTKQFLLLAMASVMAVAVTFTACKEDAPEEPLLEVAAPNAISAIAPAGTTVDLTVTANTKWTATVTPAEAAAWCELDKTSGATNATVKVTIKANTAPVPRTATITFSGADVASKPITVTQTAAAAVLTATDANVTDIAAAGTTTQVVVTANVAWTASVPTNDTWVILGEPQFAEGNSGNGTFTVTVDPNGVGEAARNSTITLHTEADVNDATIAVSQLKGDDATLSLDPTTIPGVSADGDNTKTIAVTSNVSWTVTSNEDWVVITSGETGSNVGTIELNIGENTTLGSRSATVTVSASDVESQEVLITQLGVAPVLTPSPRSLTDIVAAGTSTQVVVTANVAWTVSVPTNDTWVILGEPQFAEGNSGNGTFTVTVDPNGVGGAARSSTITLHTDADVNDVPIAVSQLAGAAAVLNASGVDVTDIAAAGSSDATINVTGNVDWTAVSNKTWVTITSPAGGTGSNEGSIALSIDANTSIEGRSATVTVSANGVEPKTVNITQQGVDPILSPAPTSLTDIAAAGIINTQIVVTANVAWTASVPGGDTWVKLSAIQFAEGGDSGNGTFTVTVDPNSVGGAARNSIITLSTDADISDVEIAVSQDAGAAAVLNATGVDVTDIAAAGSSDATINVTGNVDWTAESNKTWVTITSPAGGTGSNEGTIALSIGANTSIEGRSATVTVSANGVEPKTVSITQQGVDPILSPSPTGLTDIAATGTSTDIVVTANVAWTASVPGGDTWVKLSAIQFAEGSSNGTFTVTVDPNSVGGAARNSTITLSTEADISDVEITVSQDAGVDPYITLTPESFNAPASATSDEIIKTLMLSSNIETAFEVGWGDMPSWSYRAFSSDNIDLFDGIPATIPAGGNQSISIKARNNYVNNTWNERSSTITLKGKAPYASTSATVTFTQAAQTAVLGATGANVTDIPALGSNNATINVTGNEEWTASTSDEWITIASGSPGTGTGTVALTIAPNTVETPRTGTVTVSGKHDATPVLIEVTQEAAAAADDKIEFTSSKNIAAEPVLATDGNTKTSYTIDFNATDAWSAAVVGEAWFHIDGNNSGATGDGQTLTIVIDYFKGNNALSSIVRFTAGSKDYDVTVTDNYANKVVTSNGISLAPTPVDVPGHFAPVIGQPGKLYQWGRNYAWEPTGNVSGFPGTSAFTADDVTYPAYTAGDADWTESPCPDGWSLLTQTEGGTFGTDSGSDVTIGDIKMTHTNKGLYMINLYRTGNSGTSNNSCFTWTQTNNTATQAYRYRYNYASSNDGAKERATSLYCKKN